MSAIGCVCTATRNIVRRDFGIIMAIRRWNDAPPYAFKSLQTIFFFRKAPRAPPPFCLQTFQRARLHENNASGSTRERVFVFGPAWL